MPEYLAPGVYVEETSFRTKTIEGVSTSTAAFIGPTKYGPVRGEPELLTSFADFERIYGGLDQLDYSGTLVHNYVAHAARVFFEEGGRRLYIARVYDTGNGASQASVTLAQADNAANTITITARHPGAIANQVPVTFAVKASQNLLTSVPLDANDPSSVQIAKLSGAGQYDVVLVTPPDPVPQDGLAAGVYWLERIVDDDGRNTFCLRTTDPDETCAEDAGAYVLSDMATDDVADYNIQRVSVDLTLGAMGQFGQAQTWDGLALHPQHNASLSRVFNATPTSRRTELYVPLSIASAGDNGRAIAEVLLSQNSALDNTRTIQDVIEDDSASAAASAFQVLLANGSDGQRPGATGDNGYEGDAGDTDGLKSGFRALEDLDDVSIVAAPGSTFDYATFSSDADTIQRILISHCERMRYRVAVLDSVPGHTVGEVRAYRGRVDSTHAALYYPWVRVLDPVTRNEVNMPPSGFVCGIYARNDVEHGVHKAPANEVVRSGIGFEMLLNTAQQDVLNPEGVNCFRFFEGRGLRLWGARTISSDQEWKYLNVRRYFAYMERSIEKGTQWVVFENNTHALWARVRSTIEDFLFNEWKNGRLFGAKADEAFFVRCDRSTMTQNDLDNGRLVCLIGVAPVKPAEFVIFRIGQWTAEHKA